MCSFKRDSEALANLGDQFESNACTRFPVHPPENPSKGSLSDQVKHLVAVHSQFSSNPFPILLSPSWLSASELKCFEF